MRHMIDVNLKYKSKKSGNEVLALNFWTQVNTGEGYILLAGNFNDIVVYNMRTYQIEATLQAHTDAVTCMEVDGFFLFSGSDDCTIMHWNMQTWSKIGVIGRHGDCKYFLFV